MTVADVRVDRFHARYHDVTADRSLELDHALADLVAGGLDAVLADALGSQADRAWAICISEVTVEVTLGGSAVTAPVAAWAEAVAAAVRVALAGCGGASPAEPGGYHVSAASGSPGAVVVFMTRGDALVDLVRRVALDDHRHVWAWRQAGLVHGREPVVDRRDVVAALRVEPLLVPGVLREVGPELFGRVVAPAGLAELAALLAARVTSPAAEAAVPETAVEAAAVGRAVAALPAEARRGVRATSAARPLAVLAALTADPRRATDPAFLDAVAAVVSGSGPGPVPISGSAAETAADPSPEQSPHDEPVIEPEGEPTAWGGVWFLAHGLAATGVALTLPSAAALARLVAGFTTAPYDDPAVRRLCGLDPDDAPDPDEPPDPEGLEALTAWLACLADGRLATIEPDRLWRRTAVIHECPGLLEVELSLTEVDPVVRAAGLDLDPSWVGWLGSFVRFRYA